MELRHWHSGALRGSGFGEGQFAILFDWKTSSAFFLFIAHCGPSSGCCQIGVRQRISGADLLCPRTLNLLKTSMILHVMSLCFLFSYRFLSSLFLCPVCSRMFLCPMCSGMSLRPPLFWLVVVH